MSDARDLGQPAPKNDLEARDAELGPELRPLDSEVAGVAGVAGVEGPDIPLRPTVAEGQISEGLNTPPRRRTLRSYIFVSDKFLLISTGITANVLRIGTMFILARIIPKPDFGLYGIVLAVPGLLTGLGDLGAHVVVYQARDLPTDEVVDTAIVMVGAVSIVYGLVYLGGGIYLASSTHDWRALPVALIVACSSSLAMFYSVQINKLNRLFKFGSESKQNLIFSFTNCVTGIAFAFLHFGVFAIAFQVLISQLLANLFALGKSDLRWPSQASWRVFKRATSLTWSVTGANYISGLEARTYELVNAKAGGTGGMNLLADWRQALNVQGLLSQNISATFERVIIPKLNDSVNDPPRFEALTASALDVLGVINIGLCVWLHANAHDAISIMLGEKWLSMVPTLKIIALSMPLTAFSVLSFNVAMAKGRTGSLLWLSIPRVAIACGLALTIATSSTDLAWINTSTRILFMIASFVVVARIAALKLLPTVMPFLTILLAGALSWGAMVLISAQLPILRPILRISAASIPGLLVFIAALALLRPQVVRAIVRMTKRS